MTRLSGGHSLSLIKCLRSSTEWRQQGCVVGEPAWWISLDDPECKREPVFANEIVLSPDRTQLHYDYLAQEEETLMKLHTAEEEEKVRIWAKVYDIILTLGEEHAVCDESPPLH